MTKASAKPEDKAQEVFTASMSHIGRLIPAGYMIGGLVQTTEEQATEATSQWVRPKQA